MGSDKHRYRHRICYLPEKLCTYSSRGQIVGITWNDNTYQYCACVQRIRRKCEISRASVNIEKCGTKQWRLCICGLQKHNIMYYVKAKELSKFVCQKYDNNGKMFQRK